ncbi:MAG: penicillin-binding protein 1C [Beijerinckiaceae bacterium]
MNGRRSIAIVAAATAFFSLAIPAAWNHYVSALGPLDVSETGRSSAVVVDRHGRLLRAFTMADGRWRLPVKSTEPDPRLVSMLLAYEDHRFATHKGVDYAALARAAWQWATSGHVVSGGSTLTMQVARLLEPREERSLAAKLHQLVRAHEIEAEFAKSTILDFYFGLAPYGGNIEGIRAASLAYFGKEPKRLSIAEAALLVALPQAPEARRPDRFPNAARAARDKVIDRVFARGIISAAERDFAKQEPVPQYRRPFPMLAPHAAEAALREFPDMRVHRLTLDAKWQVSLEQLAREGAERVGPKISAAILVIDNASGEIRAHVGAADYFSAPRSGAIDMTQILRSPGSALKPFIYALAFENGLAHPETIVDDRPKRYGTYAPENFNLGYEGTVTARHALQMSLNLPAIELLDLVGPSHFLARLHNAGAEVVLSKDAPPGLAIGLGGLGIKLRDLAKLYAGLARGGSVPPIHERMREAQTPQADWHRITEPVAAWYIADILRGAPPPENAPAGRLAYKTGTSYGFRDALAVGFDKAHTIAVWVGRPDNGAVPGLVGRAVAAPILFDAFARIGSSYEPIARPRDALIARTASLPPPLRHLRKDTPKILSATNTAELKIVYPPDGARIDLGLSDSQDAHTALALKAQGGVPPLTWIINGAPVSEPELRRQSTWAPDGAGFARVSVIDAKGASDSVVVRLE